MATPTSTHSQCIDLLIDEQVHHCKLELVEGTGKKTGKVFARGEFGHAVRPTANKRLYGPSIWENNIKRLKDSIANKRVLGEMDHPENGRTSLQRASHVITDLRLEGDIVTGEAEILDTAKGRDLKAIFAAGVPVGISSRGYGSTKPNQAKGYEEVQEDYKLVTFDFVVEPADPSAYPEVVFENAEEGTAVMFEGAELFEQPEADDDGDTLSPVETPSPIEITEPIQIEALREEFAREVLAKVDELRVGVVEQVRAEIREESGSDGDLATVVSEQAEEIEQLQAQLVEANEEVERRGELVETLTRAARAAGYNFHLERLIGGEEDAEHYRQIVGDVSQYESAEALAERVDEIREELDTRRVHKERQAARVDAREDKLRTKNQELAEGLEQALVTNRELALRLYASQRLQTHPKGGKILRMLERTGFQSKSQIDDMIEDFREPMMDADDLEMVRDRVRARLGGGAEHIQEDEHSTRSNGAARRDYNGLGVTLGELKHLSGMRG